MKPGTGSQTAVLVCMGRALAHDTSPGTRFSDPTALALLPDEARARVEAFRAGGRLRGRLRFQKALLSRQSKMMVVRTVVIDDVVRAGAAPQVVILGAGLDGRAWRLAELRDSVVFEVDHPDSQRDKRARVPRLTQDAGEVRFVPVDFARDDLDAALAAAGHDPQRATTWIWEGVVMYLDATAIAATLEVVERRSCAGSRLVVLYHCPSFLLWLLGPLVRLLGEPLRSAFTADQMRALLARYRYSVTDDQSVATLGAAYPAEVARATRVMKHLRIVTAEYARTGG